MLVTRKRSRGGLDENRCPGSPPRLITPYKDVSFDDTVRLRLPGVFPPYCRRRRGLLPLSKEALFSSALIVWLIG